MAEQQSIMGCRFQSGNYGSLIVYKCADLTDRYRIVGLLVESGPWAGTKVGIPEYELGDRFPQIK